MSEENNAQNLTTVSEVDIDLDAMFGMPGAENVMLPADGKEPEKPKTMFTKEIVDVTFLDTPGTETPKVTAQEKVEINETIDELNGLISQEEDAGNKGRPKVDKSGLYELAQKMIEEGSLRV